MILRAAIELHNDINAAIDSKEAHTMLFEEDYLDISGDLLSEMRLLVEGAITLFEDDTSCLNRLATEAGHPEARSALNDIGAALYIMRRYIKRLQVEQHKASAQAISDK